MRDATDYYNLLSDTLKNGANQIKYLYEKIENAKSEGKYINIRTGYLIQLKDYNDKDYFFNNDEDFPLCYNFSCCGLARKKVIKKMMDFYLSCLKEFDNSHDEDLMKEKIMNELEMAKNDYEYLNKNNNGNDDLKLFRTNKHPGEESDNEPSINTSSFINDESLDEEEEENKNSFIDDESISEKKEKKRKCKLIKNGKKVINEYKEELNDLLEENYDGEEELNQEDDEDNEEYQEISDNEEESEKNKDKELNLKKIKKEKLLNKKIKRNIINDSDEDENDINKKEKIEEDIQNLFKKYENSKDENKEQNLADKEYINQLKENMSLKQKTLDDFLKLK